MRKVYFKLIAMALALILSVTVVIMSSYAWLVLSGNPTVSGIQVAIGGGNTILMAPNIREEISKGEVYCYPGRFSDKLNFGQEKQYDFLQELGSLTPVSTYNGIDWYLPAYYSGNDPEVQAGKVPSGYLKDFSEFSVDSKLSYANLPSSETGKISKGSYIYLDFWVVSPGGDYTLRVSSGNDTENGGSFVIDLLQPVEEETGYKLSTTAGSAAAAVRVGFLANDLMLIDDTMQHYQESKYGDNRFHSLRGFYQDPDQDPVYLEENRFTIYEPNGDLHPEHEDLDGKYVETAPLAQVDGTAAEQSVQDRLTVQRASFWSPAENGADTTALEQRFQAALITMDTQNMSALQIMNEFYGSYLQGQISPYITKGDFIRRTSQLYTDMYLNGGVATADKLYDDKHPGATEDEGIYIIKLERNVPQRIRMFIWLEGQDIDCLKSVNSSCFAVNIELAGGSEK